MLLLVLFYSRVILFNPHTSSDRGCGAVRGGMADGTADSTVECTVDCVFVLVSDLLGTPRICRRVPTGSLLTHFLCSVVSGRAAASFAVVYLRVVVQQAPVLRVEVDQVDRPRVALDATTVDAVAALVDVGPAASNPVAYFLGCLSADIEDLEVSIPASVPASIAGAQL